MRKCNVVSINMPVTGGNITPETNMERILTSIDNIAILKPDLVCLPEFFLEAGTSGSIDREKISKLAFETLSRKAAELKTYIVAGAYEIIDGKMYNCAWLIDRGGNLSGRYIKNHPVDFEMEMGVYPGSEVPVFETDFGKLGILICFDIDWIDPWVELGKKGAEAVVWISAYEGGYPLCAHAAGNMYYVFSSVWGRKARIIDMTGEVLTSSSRWIDWAFMQVSMDKTMFHMDKQADRIVTVQRELGSRITLTTYDEESRFTIESNDPSLPMDKIIEKYGLVTFREYHGRTEVMHKKMRNT